MVPTQINLQNFSKNEKKLQKQAAPKGRQAKKIAATKRKRPDAKRVLTMSSKKLAKLEGKDDQPKSVTDDLDFNAVKQVAQNQTVIFEPLPGPQTEFLAAVVEATEALAGASALTFYLGTGDDDDECVAAYAMAGKSVGATAPSLPGAAYIGA